MMPKAVINDDHEQAEERGKTTGLVSLIWEHNSTNFNSSLSV